MAPPAGADAAAGAAPVRYWRDGRTVAWEEGAVGLGAHGLHHATAVFEGIRGHAAPNGELALFRVDDHLRRLVRSANLLRIPLELDAGALRRGIDEVLEGCPLTDVYVRPIVFIRDERLGVDLRGMRSSYAVMLWTLAPPPAPGHAPPLRTVISGWRRPDPLSYPVQAKAASAYVGASLAKTEALLAGYDEAIQVGQSGLVAEATCANLFTVRDGRLSTPRVGDGALEGITRDTVRVLAERLGHPVAETQVTVSDLLAADEAFITGTFAGIVPVGSVGAHRLPPERPVMLELQRRYTDCVTGKLPGLEQWITREPVLTGEEGVAR